MHLAPIAEALERAEYEPVRSLSSTPPQHGKTFIISHAFVRLMMRRPGLDHAYVTYQQARARAVSRQVFRLAMAAGLSPKGNLDLWYLASGGSFKAAGIDTGLTGTPVTGLLVVDDPHKNRAEAESATLRERVVEEFDSAVDTRTHTTTSIIVNHTRWHPDDLIGQLAGRTGDAAWPPRINLPAINENGEPLWPEVQPLWKLLKAQAANEYNWWSLFMGEPRPRGGAVFRDVRFYETPPKEFRVAIGVDLAYTSKTHSDWCVAVVLAESDGAYYVLDVRREQADPPTFAAQLRTLRAAYPGSRWLWYTSTTEKGLADLLREQSGFPIIGEIATADKFVRAQPVAAAWNKGKVHVPAKASWVSDFVSEVCGFTGVGDKHDDQVDAFAAAFDMLARGAGMPAPRAFSNHFQNFGGNPFTPPPAPDPTAFEGDGGVKF